MLKNIGNFNNTNDYLPLFNAVLHLLTFQTPIIYKPFYK